MRILYLCTANICRSPFAEAYARMLAEKLGDRDTHVESAGTHAPTGKPSDPVMIRLGKGFGLDLTQHQSKPVDADMVARAQRIVVMERAHAAYMREHFPQSARSLVLVREDGRDLFDPTGAGLSDYQRMIENLTRELERQMMQIKYPS